MNERATATIAAPQPAPPRARHIVLGALLFAAALLLALGAALAWLVATPSGTAWLLARLPGVTVTAPQGRLLGEFAADRVEIAFGDGGRVVLQALRWRGLSAGRAAGADQWLTVRLDELQARRVDIVLPATSDDAAASEPLAPPASLRLPVEFELRALQIGELHAAALGDQPLRGLRTRVHLGSDAGSVHRVGELALGWGKLSASATAQIAADAPFDLALQFAATQDASAEFAAWRASASLTGPLTAPLLEATLHTRPQADRAEQSLDARATLRPFERWPIGELQARTRALDLSAFHPAAPATALSGEAFATTSGLDRPATIALRFDNTQAGRWDQGRAPVRRIDAQLRGRLDELERLDLLSLAIELGSHDAAAGRIDGTGSWTPSRWSLDAKLDDVQPARLDGRAPAMRVGGPLTITGTGFDAAARTAARLDVKTALSGRLAGETLGMAQRPALPRDVRLDLDASLNALRIELRELNARTGGARASAGGTLDRADLQAGWKLAARAELVDFDPSAWLPGRDDAPWRKGPHRLNADGRLDLRLPAGDDPAALLDRLAALHGTASVSIGRSVLGGVALSGQVSLANPDGVRALPSASLEVGGNRVRIEGRVGTAGLIAPATGTATGAATGASDQWQIDIDAPALARLAPLVQVALPPGEAPRLAGALQGQARIDGRWPQLRAVGQLEARGLRWAEGSIAEAQARWTLGSAADGPMQLQARLTQPGWGEQKLESVELRIDGTGREHRLELRGESALLPPAWVDAVHSRGTRPTAGPAAGVAATAAGGAIAGAAAAPAASATAPAAKRSIALLRARGGWLAAAGAPRAGWRGTLERIELAGDADGAPPWLRSSDIGVELQWSGGPARVLAQPGRIEVLGGALRWSRLDWQAAAAGAPAQVDVQAELEPLRVAPILARLQPGFGWGGDLSVGGHVRLRAAPGMTADVVIERRGGDLSVTDETGTQKLGLTDLRVALDARDGVWNFTQALAGTTLGIGAGAVVAHTLPQARLPDADTPIQGVVELQVANLGTWGTWVPAGWRLGGALRTSASIGGRFGAPEYTGEVLGSNLSVRNFLEGVNVSDGELRIGLKGETARIERFTLKGGDGRLDLDGAASFGESPQARLDVRAERFQLLGRVDRRIVTSGQAQLRLDRDSLALNGRFGVDEALIDFTRGDAPSLAGDVEVVRARPRTPVPEKPDKPAAKRRIALDLRVDLGDELKLRGRGLDTRLRGTLRITSPENRMAVTGDVRTDQGRYVAYGQKLVIDRGVVSFNGSVENPRLNIEAVRPDLDVRVGVAITGTAVNPRVKLFSVPELSEKDKLSWLLLGRPSDTLGGTEAALLQQAAVALVSGEGEGKTEQVIRAIGLDQLSLRQRDGEVRETVISLGKQISRRWYVGYERSLNATAGTWQLIYRFAQSFTLRAQAGLDNSFDAIWSWRW